MKITLKLAEGVSLDIELDQVIWEGPVEEIFEGDFSGLTPDTEVIVIVKSLVEGDDD